VRVLTVDKVPREKHASETSRGVEQCYNGAILEASVEWEKRGRKRRVLPDFTVRSREACPSEKRRRQSTGFGIVI
jgi:hypothetical protein